ncbi:hypothetical protein JD969_07960 [Planctomycetota bacterium]|nr:hypothetical protein JD969_07960 [Planctomycetota bacterium]
MQQQNATTSPAETQTTAQKSKLATIALILAILGLLTSPILLGIPIAFIAIILGFSTAAKIKKSNNTITGKTKAHISVTLGLIACTIVPTLLVFVGWPMYQQAAYTARNLQTQANGKLLGLAYVIHLEQHKTPPTAITDLIPFVDDESVFYSPHSEKTASADFLSMPDEQKAKHIRIRSDFIFVPNNNASKQINPSEQMILFSNPLLTDEEHYTVVFADGHAEQYQGSDQKRFVVAARTQSGLNPNKLIAKQRSNR